eukprot:gene18476-24188_t
METILLFCCKSCLKGGDNKEYYEVLGLTNNNVSTDEIKKAYKKISLSLHPDKLAQRGIEITPEHKQQFLKVKEAHDVLSDPRRRRLYDQLGASGCSCCCIFCGVISLASVDTDELEQAYKNADGYNATNTASFNLEKKDITNPGDYEPPVIESAYGTFATIDQPIFVNGNENNNNTNSDSKEEVSAVSVLIEID